MFFAFCVISYAQQIPQSVINNVTREQNERTRRINQGVAELQHKDLGGVDMPFVKKIRQQIPPAPSAEEIRSKLSPSPTVEELTLPTRIKKMENRFLSYVEIESQSIDDPDMSSFPMTEGQRQIAIYIYIMK